MKDEMKKYQTAWTWYSPTIGMGKFAEAKKWILVGDSKMTEDSIAVKVYLVPCNKNFRVKKNLK